MNRHLRSPPIGRCRAVFAPTRCIVGMVSGSESAVGSLVVVGCWCLGFNSEDFT